MIGKKTFKQTIANLFEKSSFVKKGQSWYLDGEDTIIVVKLQKSNWGEEYYINIGIRLKALGTVNFPQESQCHFSHRLERYFPDDRELILRGSSLEASNSQTLEDFTELLRIKLVPFLKECTSKHKLKEFLVAGRFNSGFISKDAIDYLSET